MKITFVPKPDVTQFITTERLFIVISSFFNFVVLRRNGVKIGHFMVSVHVFPGDPNIRSRAALILL